MNYSSSYFESLTSFIGLNFCQVIKFLQCLLKFKKKFIQNYLLKSQSKHERDDDNLWKTSIILYMLRKTSILG